MRKNGVAEVGKDAIEKVGRDLVKKTTGDARDSTLEGSSTDEKKFIISLRDNKMARELWRIVTWTPRRCRWDPDSPPKFSMSLNLLFGFVSVHYACMQTLSFVGNAPGARTMAIQQSRGLRFSRNQEPLCFRICKT